MVGSSGAFTVAAAWRPRSLSSKNLSKSWRFMAFQVSLKTSFIDFHWTFSVDLLTFADAILDQFPPFPSISIHFHLSSTVFRMPSAPHVRPAPGFSRLKSFSEFPAGAWKVKDSKNKNYRVELDLELRLHHAIFEEFVGIQPWKNHDHMGKYWGIESSIWGTFNVGLFGFEASHIRISTNTGVLDVQHIRCPRLQSRSLRSLWRILSFQRPFAWSPGKARKRHPTPNSPSPLVPPKRKNAPSGSQNVPECPRCQNSQGTPIFKQAKCGHQKLFARLLR